MGVKPSTGRPCLHGGGRGCQRIKRFGLIAVPYKVSPELADKTAVGVSLEIAFLVLLAAG
jgi:hypothetical protein